ncbi:hypothetical protein FALB51S_01967 [Frigidibacter albus]|uniref:Uncharacterized protein n=1 Tax=Frigidibacter mobilis TaxID=1335048 RepID=A0A159Z065_9RHOB|nr:hypothetical protein AKL17_1007 [Frigidibacter mobilis]
MPISIPSRRSSEPPVKRVWPEVMSSPTVPSSTPRNTIIAPRTAPVPDTAAAEISPSSMIAKYSAGPNSSAKVASVGDRPAMIPMPSTPPAKDAIAVMNSATPARLAFAIG